ncbi:MAG: hypothetical protein ACRC8K_15745 [Waterburya sp.]
MSRFRSDINTASLRGYRASRTIPCNLSEVANYRCEVCCHQSQEVIKIAEKKAIQLGAAIALGEFDWSDYLTKDARSIR